METTTDLVPRLSVIVPGLQGFGSILAAMDAWRAQGCAADIEILVLCPDDPGPALQQNERWVGIKGLQLHEARAAGIRAARAAHVMVAEDHCLPAEGCVQALLDALEGGGEVLAPTLRSALPHRVVTSAAFLIGYGEWIPPMSPDGVRSLPGHNSVIPRDVVVRWGAELERELIIGAFLMRRLQQSGARAAMEPRAMMWHFDEPGWWKTMLIFGSVGLGFGARRSLGWGFPLRLCYALAAPAVAAKHWSRAATHYFRAGRSAGLHPLCLAVSVLWASCWAIGEALGSICGVSRAAGFVSYAELKPVSREVAQRAMAALAGRHHPASEAMMEADGLEQSGSTR